MSTYTPIASVTLSNAQSSVTFSGIPQTYTDLVLVFAGSMTSSARVDIRVGNGTIDTGSNYSNTQINGNGSTAASQRYSNSTTMQGMFDAVGTGTGQVVSITNFQNYTNTTTNKTVIGRSNSASNGTSAYIGLWRSVSAINTISLIPTSDFASGSTFNLYGISSENASTPKATGGNQVYSDGTNWYHVFTSSGTFTPTQSITADCLVVAGGGGGLAGGGGGGGLLTHTSQSLTAQGYTITVGAGGASYANGSNSQFGSLTASVGGGRGGFNSTTNPAGNGGSGGGSAGLTSSPFGALAGGTGTSGQGNNGGSGFWGNAYAGGGGGGAGAVGGNSGTSGATNGNGGVGGAGLASSLSGTSVTYAGGGGGAGNLAGASGWNGGAGGSGGGGAGTTTSTGVAGTANTGGGGGGGQTTGGAGGSGIVIIRYSAA